MNGYTPASGVRERLARTGRPRIRWRRARWWREIPVRPSPRRVIAAAPARRIR